MRLSAAHMQLAQLVWMIVLAITSVAATAHPVALPGCSDTCGNISIPYPFGIGQSSKTRQNCFLDNQSFEVTCHENRTLKSGNFTVLNISYEKGQLEMSSPIAGQCDNASKSSSSASNMPSLRMPAFAISTKENKFITVGCGFAGYLYSFGSDRQYSTFCYSRYCNSSADDKSAKNCYKKGQGCCQVDLPCGMRNISIDLEKYNPSVSRSSGETTSVTPQLWASDRRRNITTSSRSDNCGFAFIVKQDSYDFSLDEFSKNKPDAKTMVVDWAIGNWSCEDARNKSDFFACKENSECVDADNKYGYRCRCKDGYRGNPYLPRGCLAINPCRGLRCWSDNHLIMLTVGVIAGFLVLVILISSLCWVHKQRKITQLRRKYFEQNGGLMLKGTKTFKEVELEKATDNFHDSRIIGRGGHAVVYRGILTDNTPVAIKKSSTTVGLREVKDFIYEMIMLSQIKHPNVVILLGFCLETKVPLLVYEFVSNGTLLHHIDPRNEGTISWETRLRIAADTAEAVSYLHSAEPNPIIHRDIKSSNILLDQNNNAKVSDFGASRLVPLDPAQFATAFQGTPGYWDPEYIRTAQLNEKSDVYSFGVVLMELLTGKKPVEFSGEKPKTLANEFLCLMKEGRLLDILDRRVMNKRNVDQLQEVALLAERCVRMKGEERPSMKEVAEELKGLIMAMEKHPWVKGDVIPEENEYLLGEASSSYGDAGIGNSTDCYSKQNQMPLEIGNGR